MRAQTRRPILVAGLLGVLALAAGCTPPLETLRNNMVGKKWWGQKGGYHAVEFRPDGTAAVTFRGKDGPFTVPARYSLVEHDNGFDRLALDLEFAPAEEHRRAYREAFGEDLPATRRHGVRIYKGYLLIFDGHKPEPERAEFTEVPPADR